jgi:hypothetical protein
MRTWIVSPLVVVSALLLAPGAALADLPRPEGWVPSCSLEKEQKSGGPCEQCRGWASPDPCQEALAKKGYTRRCQEGGAGSYVAVWCQGAAAAEPPATPGTVRPSSGRCGVSAGLGDRTGLMVLTVALALAVARGGRNRGGQG